MAVIQSIVGAINGFTWGTGMLILIGGAGIVFTIGLKFFQFAHFGDMWRRILDRGDSDTGISTFASFCTTMAMRIGTGNVTGVAAAIYNGGPGALFWMILIGITNSAVCFVETTVGSLYKTRLDGQYRGGGYYCAERGLGWKPYGVFLAIVFGLGTALFMPAAATYTVADGFSNATGVPLWVVSLIIAIAVALIVAGGIRRIGDVASLIVPFMTVIYIAAVIIVVVLNFTRIPAVIADVVASAFGGRAVFGAAVGTAIQWGIKRGTFSSASGMGESTPTAAAAETSHPVKTGMANAAGVWLDTVIVCTCTGLLILMTDCFNTAGGYVGSGAAALAAADFDIGSGIILPQLAMEQVMGGAGKLFVAVMLLLFSFTCLISYYYEAETAIIYLCKGEGKQQLRKTITTVLKIVMPVLIFIWGIIPSQMAWDLSDSALGICTWFNMVVVILLFPKAIALNNDYQRQMKAGQDPYYDPDTPGLCWKGVDADLWRDINKKYIEAAKKK